MAEECTYVDYEDGENEEITKSFLRQRFLAKGFDGRVADMVAGHVLKRLNQQPERVISGRDLEDAIQFASALAMRRGGPAAAVAAAAQTTADVVAAVDTVSVWIGDDVAPWCDGVSAVSTLGCCKEPEKGVKVKLSIKVGDPDDWGWSTGVTDVEVTSLMPNGERVGLTGKKTGMGDFWGGLTPGQEHIVEVELCIPCAAISDGRVSINIVVRDTARNSISSNWNIPVDTRDCCG